MKMTIEVNQEQINVIRETLNLPEYVSDERCVELFIIENTCVDEEGFGF